MNPVLAGIAPSLIRAMNARKRPGDPLLAHTAGEWVDRASLDACYQRLVAFLRG